jgi:hypothetical protein
MGVGGVSAENAGQKQRRGRPFRKGESGNPAGKRPGTRNRATRLLESISDADLAAIIGTLVEKAKAGDASAAKILLDRLVPVPRARAVAIELSAIGAWDGKDAVLNSHRAIVEAVAAGDVSPAEGLDLIAVIEAQRAAVEGLRPDAMHRQPTQEEVEQEREMLRNLPMLKL